MQQITKYFTDLSELQHDKLSLLFDIYKDWNQKINLISRKDFTFFYERHVLHSLSIAKAFRLPDGCHVMDAGTGGGFPGIPLAIVFPRVHFHLVDSTGKKINAVEMIARQLDLQNVTTENNRVESVKQKFNFIVSRAVAPLPEIIKWTGSKLKPKELDGVKPGIIYLKGGDITKELSQISWNYRIIAVKDYFNESYFNTKVIVHLHKP